MWIVSALILTAAGTAYAADTWKVVKLAQGPVKGYEHPEGIYEFYGIPYATAPKGASKFKAPLSPPVWDETFEAVRKDIICPQVPYDFGQNVTVAEDCLVANVFVPNTTETNLPVLVYIHGGGFHFGHGNIMTFRTVAREGNLIVVSFNYRLTVFGFLCLGTETAPGNAGMKDQVALLRWVQKNIRAFGGDPKNVIIEGGSAGSASVELLMLSDMARGLFNKVIPESGSALAPWGVQIDPIAVATSYARKLGYDFYNITDLENFFLTVTEVSMADVFLEKDATFKFGPCIEKYTEVEMFLKESPIDILKRGSYEKLPVLIGFTKMEGSLRLPDFEQRSKQMNEKFSDFIPGDLMFENDYEKESVARNVKKYYFGDKAVSSDTLQGYIDFHSDTIFIYPILRSAKLQIEAGNKNVYLYEYVFSDDVFQPWFNYFPDINGANHMSQSGAFSDQYQSNNNLKENRKLMHKILRELWITYIKTGAPSSPALSVAWAAAGAELGPHAELALPPLVQARLQLDRYHLWDDIYKKHYRKPVPPADVTTHAV